VKRFESLEEARTADGTVLTLHRHDGEYVIRENGIELMSSRRHDSEDRLAELVCAPLARSPSVRVLIGGLGLGYTLRAALAVLGPDARVVVAEISAAVIEWNMNPAYDLAAAALGDRRVELVHADVSDVLERNPGAFDGIMLDVDNGPDPLATASNARRYGDAAIRMTAAALRAGGRLAYWSVTGNPDFERSLRRAGLTVETVRARARGTGGNRHTVFVGRSA
jgi:spermidine synthase